MRTKIMKNADPVDTGKHLGASLVASGLPEGGLESDHFVAWQEVDKENTLNNVWVRVDYSLEDRDAELQRLWLQSFWMALILTGVVAAKTSEVCHGLGIKTTFQCRVSTN